MYKSSYTGSQIDEAVAKANAAAPQSTTYTKTEVDSALSGKQSTLVVGTNLDSTPTENSTNPVTSGGVYQALATKLNTADVDAALDSTSTNPVQNKVVQAPIARLVDAGAKNLLKNEQNSGTTVTNNGATWIFSKGTMEASVSGTVGTTWSDVSILNATIDLSDKEYVVLVQSDAETMFAYLPGNTITGGNIPTNGQYYPGTYRFKGIIAANARFTARTGSLNNNFLRVMICTAEDYEASSEFVPYAPTNRELYEMILALQSGT